MIISKKGSTGGRVHEQRSSARGDGERSSFRLLCPILSSFQRILISHTDNLTGVIEIQI